MIQIEKNRKIVLATTIIPLIVGGVLYYITCPEVFFVRMIDHYTNLNLHIEYDIEKSILARILRNQFFDFIWAFSFTNALSLILDNDTKASIKCCFISIVVGSILELLQLAGIVYGTFDIWDIVSEILGTTSAILFITIVRRKET